ncbi:hypothetical protein [Christiangramia forsetii]|uniref:Uncharacterized protein n=2 Tax=Christiangramia forsetii TaxID=411153 RepID=A0M627_CHRFK|nr:hypothetical protein [Christiangramia forsetii]GGG31553.1 hypothetical protein GCM10011532_13820 [Christiangramia forsetii]CAL68072.1 hypothetical protein GFO_3128 [Christiangramia forsetii KT0803]
MKISFLAFVIFLFSTNDCTNQKDENINVISYETFTRGSSTMYTVTPNQVTVKSTGLNTIENSNSITAEDWNSLIEITNKIEASKMSQLKAPSDSRASDAALHAILSVRKNDTIYKTNSFDHGHPPLEVKPLVEAILRLAENVE